VAGRQPAGQRRSQPAQLLVDDWQQFRRRLHFRRGPVTFLVGHGATPVSPGETPKIVTAKCAYYRMSRRQAQAGPARGSPIPRSVASCSPTGQGPRRGPVPGHRARRSRPAPFLRHRNVISVQVSVQRGDTPSTRSLADARL
jgi:hypothetical protein